MGRFYLQCPCGEPIAKSRWRLGKRDCVPCALARSVQHTLQMKRKSGPGWDRYLLSLRRILAEDSSAVDGVDHGNQGDGVLDH